MAGARSLERGGYAMVRNNFGVLLQVCLSSSLLFQLWTAPPLHPFRCPCEHTEPGIIKLQDGSARHPTRTNLAGVGRVPYTSRPPLNALKRPSKGARQTDRQTDNLVERHTASDGRRRTLLVVVAGPALSHTREFKMSMFDICYRSLIVFKHTSARDLRVSFWSRAAGRGRA